MVLIVWVGLAFAVLSLCACSDVYVVWGDRSVFVGNVARVYLAPSFADVTTGLKADFQFAIHAPSHDVSFASVMTSGT
jgi:hypothetical protein